MPSKKTLQIHPIEEWALQYVKSSRLIIDPFAADCRIGSITNDLNPEMPTTHHMLAEKFLSLEEVKDADLVIFDPPYSLRQVKECYENFGAGFFQKDAQNAQRWTIERDIIAGWQKPGGVVLSFGWTSVCMGRKRGYEIDSILLCAHGPAHNDTICVAEIKQPTQENEK